MPVKFFINVLTVGQFLNQNKVIVVYSVHMEVLCVHLNKRGLKMIDYGFTKEVDMSFEEAVAIVT
jgi:hypothetical protein